MYGCSSYRLAGTCYVDFRLAGGPGADFRYHDDRANYKAIRGAIRNRRRFTVTSGFCSNLYCWPAKIRTSGRVLVRKEQSVADAEDKLLLRAGLGVIAIVLSITVFIIALRRG